TQVRRDVPMRDVMTRFGRTLRLAALTTACGAFALLWSGFPGLTQLGVLTIVGVLVAGAATWWVLPHWVPARWAPAITAGRPDFALPMVRGMRVAVVAGVTLLAVAGTWGKPWWNDDLAAMNPLPESYKARDIRLRGAIGAPDVRFAVAVSGSTRESVLQSSEALRARLQGWLEEGAISSFDLVSDYVPSEATQSRRRTNLPAIEPLREHLDAAARGLPFRAQTFDPFVQAVAAARNAPPLTADNYAGSALGLKVESMLRKEGDSWHVVIPLAGVKDPAAISRELPVNVRVLDLRGEAALMMAAYRGQAVLSSAIGLVLIFVALAVGLPGIRAACRVLAPVVLAVIATAGFLVAIGQPLTVFHYVALLLTAGVGVNYALVRVWGATGNHPSGTWRTLSIVSATALATFGLLALSSAPVLRAIGETVCIGVVLSLAFGALLIHGGPARASPR
ncbi:MAG: hypothetical protein ABI624_24080, partial [Casimicrobiaceae bacterium]